MGRARVRVGRLAVVGMYVWIWWASAEGGDPPLVFVARQTPHEGQVWWTSPDEPLPARPPVRVLAL